MPCFVTGSAEGDARLAADEARQEATKVTRMLCGIMAELELDDSDHLARRVPGLSSWWENHKKIDEVRRKQEVKEKKQRDIEAKVEAYRKKLNSEG